MISELTYLLAAELQDLNFLELCTGAIKTAKIKVRKQDNTNVEKTYPIYLNLYPTVCNASQYVDLVPNSKLKGISYFEDNGTIITASNNRFVEYESRVRLVVWLNLRLINFQVKDSDVYMQRVIDKMPLQLQPIDYISGIRINLDSSEPKTSDIFSKYSYDEAEKQYLIYPFDYFALNYILKYRVAKNCLSVAEMRPCDCQAIKRLKIGTWVIGDCSQIG